MRWDCWEPYMDIDNCEYEISKMEELCAKLEEQAALFEVPVPEFRLLRKFRHELKNVKVSLFIRFGSNNMIEN